MKVLPRRTAKDAIYVIPRLDWQSHLGIIFFASHYLTLDNCRSTPRSEWIVRLDGSFFRVKNRELFIRRLSLAHT